MTKSFLILIIIFVSSSPAFSVVGLSKISTVPRTISPPPAVTTRAPITIAPQTIVPLQIDLSSLASFQTSHYFDRCELGSNLPPDFMKMVDSLYSSCENQVENAMRQPTHAAKIAVLATEACPCFRSDTSLYSMISPPLTRGARGAAQARGGILGFGRQDPPPGEEVIINSVNRANTHLADLRNGIMFQASILSADPQIMEGLARVYSNGFYQNATAAFATANERLQTEFRKPAERRQSTLDASLQIPQYDPNILIGRTPSPSCVSMRDFRSYRQFPEDSKFYEDLLNPQHQRFESRAWSFPRLKDQLSDLCRDNHILTLDEAKNDPRTGWVVRRLDFLNRNPLLKNLMSGTGRDGKEELFNLVMNTFKPQDTSCTSGGGVAHACQVQAVRKAQSFRDGLLGIFRRPDVAQRVARESQLELTKSLETLPQIITKAHHIPTAEELRVFDPVEIRTLAQRRDAQGASVEVQNENDRLLRLRVSSMNQMCPTIETSNSLNGNYVVNELEGQWADEIQDPVFDQGTQSFANNPGFDEFRNNICNRGSGDERISFEHFLQENCFGGRTCENPKAMFIRRYPSGAGIDQAMVFAEFSINAPLKNLGERAVTAVSKTSGQSYNDLVRNIDSDLQTTFSSSGNSMSRTAAVAPVSSGSQASTQNSTSSQTNPNPVLNPAITPEVFQPVISPPPPEVRAEVLRREVRESDSQAQEIRNEISGLRDVLRQGADSQNPQDQNYQDLTSRFAVLERRLADAEKRKRDAETELRRIESQVVTPQAVTRVEPEVSPSLRRGTTSGTTSGGGDVARSSAPQVTSGSFSGGSEARNFAPTSVSSSSGVSGSRGTQVNGALLAKYGVPAGLASSGAIIVASSDSQVDVERLRGDSESSVLPLTITVDEFNRISSEGQGSILAPYLDRVRAVPGEVVRLNISTSDNRSMELFVLKSDSGISIVQAPTGATRGIASERGPREVTLDGLRNELSR
ncbi:MAG: hypothetical protein V4598_01295 [Bdellovibrionota bacterium]